MQTGDCCWIGTTSGIFGVLQIGLLSKYCVLDATVGLNQYSLLLEWVVSNTARVFYGRLFYGGLYSTSRTVCSVSSWRGHQCCETSPVFCWLTVTPITWPFSQRNSSACIFLWAYQWLMICVFRRMHLDRIISDMVLKHSSEQRLLSFYKTVLKWKHICVDLARVDSLHFLPLDDNRDRRPLSLW